MTLRLLRGGHRGGLEPESGQGARKPSRRARSAPRRSPRVVSVAAPRVLPWIMLPAGKATDDMIDCFRAAASKGDLIVDGGNTNFHDDSCRAAALAAHGIGYADVGNVGRRGDCRTATALDGRRRVAVRHRAARKLRARHRLARRTAGAIPGPWVGGTSSKMIHNGIGSTAWCGARGLLRSPGERVRLRPRCALAPVEPGQRRALVAARAAGYLAFPAGPEVRRSRLRRGTRARAADGASRRLQASSRPKCSRFTLMRRFCSRQEDTFTDRVLTRWCNQFGGRGEGEVAGADRIEVPIGVPAPEAAARGAAV